jgi:hypothetical protein
MLLRPAGYATASNRTAGREIGAGVAALLRRARKTDKDASEAPKSAKWKIRIAPELRSTSTATKAWIAERPARGHPTRSAI